VLPTPKRTLLAGALSNRMSALDVKLAEVLSQLLDRNIIHVGLSWLVFVVVAAEDERIVRAAMLTSRCLSRRREGRLVLHLTESSEITFLNREQTVIHAKFVLFLRLRRLLEEWSIKIKTSRDLDLALSSLRHWKERLVKESKELSTDVLAALLRRNVELDKLESKTSTLLDFDVSAVSEERKLVQEKLCSFLQNLGLAWLELDRLLLFLFLLVFLLVFLVLRIRLDSNLAGDHLREELEGVLHESSLDTSRHLSNTGGNHQFKNLERVTLTDGVTIELSKNPNRSVKNLTDTTFEGINIIARITKEGHHHT